MPNIHKHSLKIIKNEGLFSFLKKGSFYILGQLACFFLYPLFWIMNIRFILVNYAAIGHLAGELDCYVKDGLLGRRPLYKTILLVSRKNLANRHLLNYWKRYVWVISNPILFLLFWEPLKRNKFLCYDVKKYLNDHIRGVGYPFVQKLYYGRPPVLTLSDFDRQRGEEALRKLGLPENAWFVCVHCRENGYPFQKDKYLLRDNDINNYFPAMREIVDRGGWVIRVGDPTMKLIPSSSNIIDYAHLDMKSDWMDIFLCASCRFFIGCSSGLRILAGAFGTRSVCVNTAAPFSEILVYGPEDLGIPKLIWSTKDNRYLSFREILSSPVANFYEDQVFAANNLRLVENSPEEIKDVVVEMLDRLEGKVEYSEEDERLQAQVKSLMNPAHYSYGAISRVGRSFLKKYKNLL